MRIALGIFAMSALETHVGTDIPAAINTALVYHVDKLDSDRGTTRFPAFLRDQGRHGAGGQALAAGPTAVDDLSEVEVEVDERTEAAVRREARRQGVSADALARHAILLYLAELDRVAGAWAPADSGRD